ncbi:MAG TPA: TonB-dependent receptor [Vicinamibacterales bacterium]|nr:TonB-dependent receptor [Vicinamibacterales bacterium]
MTAVLFSFLILTVAGAAAQDRPAAVQVEVRSADGPVAGATVRAGGFEVRTTAAGIARLTLSAGRHTILVTHTGFLDASHEVDLVAGQSVVVPVDLIRAPTVEEEVVVVTSTRTGRRIEDQPMRVEVLGREEIEEKMLMTPGDIVMMLNEMGGLRVQATSPSLGVASVRIQGMRGRYTRLLSDGLPLYGEQPGGIGLLQIPPMDLGQVEVIKGVASALYGAGAMGGVVNLLSRRPGDEVQREILLNVSGRGAADGVLWWSAPVGDRAGVTLLASGHRQGRVDVDDDGWADMAGYRRGVVRPRFFWGDDAGRSVFATVGITREERTGGTVPGRVLPGAGTPYREALGTTRADAGVVAQTVLDGRFVTTARAAVTGQWHDHTFGDVRERDRHTTLFGEVAVRGSSGAHTWVAGAAIERDAYRPTDVPRFAYALTTPGVFVQDDVDIRPWLTVSASGRLDWHSEYGFFASPRLSALVRHGGWTSRVSAGAGFFAPTPLTEETEAAGLSRLVVDGPIEAERGRGLSIDVGRTVGPLSWTTTLFTSRVDDPVIVERDEEYRLRNLDGRTTNVGGELLATWRREPFAVTGTYTYVRAREREGAAVRDVALTPRHSVGVVAMAESEDRGRLGLEIYVTGRQRLEADPYRTTSEPYVIVGLLAERRFGRFSLFVNGENLTGVRQSSWDPLLRPSRAVDGRWTVDAWAPLEGRVVNGGIRIWIK